MKIPNKEKVTFQKEIYRHYKKSGRVLPWRKTKNPYYILVSEVMLQQTQVTRVEEKYKSFLKKFPTLKSLAVSPLREVLREWQGLGYNRRAKMLHDAAKKVVLEHGGIFPKDMAQLIDLPGVGEYTANAIRAFAFNKPGICIETNIRAVIIHFFFENQEKVSDKEIRSCLEQVTDTKSPCVWYWALMDYGAKLKQERKVELSRSTHYVKQTQFKGSDREIRGAILRVLSKSDSAVEALPFAKKRVRAQLRKLEKEGMIEKSGQKYRLA